MRIAKTISVIMTVCALSAIAIPAQKQASKSDKKTETKSDTTAKDSAKKDTKSYAELLKGATTLRGAVTVHKVKSDYYFEIHDSLLGRDFLIVNKISGVPSVLNEVGINKGMGFGEKCVRFEKDTAQKKVIVSQLNFRASAPEGDAIARSLKDNYRPVIIEQFPIESYNEDSTAIVIKVNKVFDGSEKSFNNAFGAMELIGSTKKELSKIESVKAFPENIVIRATLSMTHTERGGSVPVTIDVTSNIVLLTKEPMVARFSDERVGYFTTDKLYYADKQQRVDERELITRWRLEPKDEDKERYKAGELVEPKTPIILYIDPATPPLWIPYIKRGIEQWQVAFEQAGFKNAIFAMEIDPEKEKDFDVDDVRYSVITYVASESANAMGPSVIDPRSGEIIEADIIWWHNVMTILGTWTRVQTGAVDSLARTNTLPTQLMGNAVQFVSSHELGHSLGLKHNMGASYSVPTDSLRSKTYTAKHGTASSIMDYARFNYVAQPEDDIKDLTPQIGKYDRHAIEWGYRWFDSKSPFEESATLSKMLRDTENDIECWYGEQQWSSPVDPRSQTEDLGNDPVKGSKYGIANLKRIVPNITDWTSEQDKLHFESGRLLMATVFQWNIFAGHVKTNVGGFYIDNLVAGQKGDRYTPVPAATQRESVQYLIDEVFTYPQWLFGAKAWDTRYAQRSSPIGQIEYAPLNMLREMQYRTYYELLADERLSRMYETEMKLGRKESYTPEDMLAQLTKAIFAKSPSTLSVTERMSQKNYVDALIVSSNLTMVKTTNKGNLHNHANGCCTLMNQAPEISSEALSTPRPEDLKAMERGIETTRHYMFMQRVSDVASAKRGEMNRILKIVSKRTNRGDLATQNHYQDLTLRLQEALRKL